MRDVVRNEPRLRELDETTSSGLGPDVVGVGLWRDHNRRLSRDPGTRLLLAWPSNHAYAGALTIALGQRALRCLRESSKHRSLLSLADG